MKPRRLFRGPSPTIRPPQLILFRASPAGKWIGSNRTRLPLHGSCNHPSPVDMVPRDQKEALGGQMTQLPINCAKGCITQEAMSNSVLHLRNNVKEATPLRRSIKSFTITPQELHAKMKRRRRKSTQNSLQPRAIYREASSGSALQTLQLLDSLAPRLFPRKSLETPRGKFQNHSS